ncbi:MKI67 FHA domain-interacting nucleolar phosphoprotein [Colossoma macropomum]|uniref:MKI67 FHA domain-interacting nucleolar phosphoprotein n=1 Tax=Colossoma macropomum TaxID=42526 RepID=UPI0018653D1C|nr:MKI67 FHA domain-interacting nucleolar phosphoprotein [Colossoma macropomum]
MTEGKKSSKSSQKLLALNPSEDAEFQKKVQQVKSKKTRPGSTLKPGVVYVGHLPQALAEPQLRAYFSQFGKVNRLRISRSKKTGRSKGYAFVEFDCDEVAKIVAETMNNYLMGERLIKCEVIPPEKVHEKLFVGSRKMFSKPKQPAVSRYNRDHDPEQMKKLTGKLLHKENKLRKRLAEKGIDYDFPGFAAQVPAKKAQSSADTSVCSEDATPVCTPSVLEKRRSMKVDDDDVDDEVIIKTQPRSENSKDVEDCEDTVEEKEEDDEEESEDED